MGAVVPERDRFPVSQRTLDLKTESAYFRVRLCVPRPRAPRVRSINPRLTRPSPASPPFAASSSGPRNRRARPRSPRRSRTRSPRPTASSGARYPSNTSRSSPRRGQNRGEEHNTEDRAPDASASLGATRATRKVRTALAMMTTTPDGAECRASVLGEAGSLVALAGECAARDLARRLIHPRGV